MSVLMYAFSRTLKPWFPPKYFFIPFFPYARCRYRKNLYLCNRKPKECGFAQMAE